MTHRVQLEVCVESLAGVRRAAECGADRVELCTALDLGGLTPSDGLVRRAVEVGLPVHVLVRPRPGDFVYDAGDLDVLRDDVRRCRDLGVAGIVTGCLTGDGEIDERAMTSLVEAAGEVSVSCHRCIDLTNDLAAAVEALKRCGVVRTLSSGGATTAFEGAAALRRLAGLQDEAFTLLAGGGVRPHNVVGLIEATGVAEVHFAPRRRVAESAFGTRWATDGELIAQMRDAVDGD